MYAKWEMEFFVKTTKKMMNQSKNRMKEPIVSTNTILGIESQIILITKGNVYIEGYAKQGMMDIHYKCLVLDPYTCEELGLKLPATNDKSRNLDKFRIYYRNNRINISDIRLTKNDKSLQDCLKENGNTSHSHYQVKGFPVYTDSRLGLKKMGKYNIRSFFWKNIQKPRFRAKDSVLFRSTERCPWNPLARDYSY